MKMTQRPKDIQDAWQKLVNKSIECEFTESERADGSARLSAEWSHSMPDDASDFQCREWYGIPQIEK